MLKVEVVVDSIDDALAAAEAGVSRVEVGCAPELGGLTPTPGVVAGIAEALAGTHIDIAVLIRPDCSGCPCSFSDGLRFFSPCLFRVCLPPVFPERVGMEIFGPNISVIQSYG